MSEEALTETMPSNEQENFGLEVKFNKENRVLNREEAVSFAQKGILYDSMKPLFDKMDILRAESGVSREAYVDALFKEHESAQMAKCREKAGDDEELYNSLLELNKMKAEKSYESLLESEKAAAKKAEAERYAANEGKLKREYELLVSDFPDAPEMDKLPVSVLKSAEEGENLLLAYYRHLHSEQEKIKAAKIKETEAAEATVGRASTVSHHSETDVISAMLSGVGTDD